MVFAGCSTASQYGAESRLAFSDSSNGVSRGFFFAARFDVCVDFPESRLIIASVFPAARCPMAPGNKVLPIPRVTRSASSWRDGSAEHRGVAKSYTNITSMHRSIPLPPVADYPTSRRTPYSCVRYVLPERSTSSSKAPTSKGAVCLSTDLQSPAAEWISRAGAYPSRVR